MTRSTERAHIHSMFRLAVTTFTCLLTLLWNGLGVFMMHVYFVTPT